MLTPGWTYGAIMSSVSAARRPALRMPSNASSPCSGTRRLSSAITDAGSSRLIARTRCWDACVGRRAPWRASRMLAACARTASARPCTDIAMQARANKRECARGSHAGAVSGSGDRGSGDPGPGAPARSRARSASQMTSKVPRLDEQGSIMMPRRAARSRPLLTAVLLLGLAGCSGGADDPFNFGPVFSSPAGPQERGVWVKPDAGPQARQSAIAACRKIARAQIDRDRRIDRDQRVGSATVGIDRPGRGPEPPAARPQPAEPAAPAVRELHARQGLAAGLRP